MTNKVGGSWQDFYLTESQHFYRKKNAQCRTNKVSKLEGINYQLNIDKLK